MRDDELVEERALDRAQVEFVAGGEGEEGAGDRGERGGEEGRGERRGSGGRRGGDGVARRYRRRRLPPEQPAVPSVAPLRQGLPELRIEQGEGPAGPRCCLTEEPDER